MTEINSSLSTYGRTSEVAQRRENCDKVTEAVTNLFSFSMALVGIGTGAILPENFLGKKINLPNNDVYTIKEGDTLNGIAKNIVGEKAPAEEINKCAQEIAKLNADIIKDKNEIHTDDKIALPRVREGKAKTSIDLD